MTLNKAEPPFSSAQLATCIGQVFILAYQESTELLEKAIANEGLPVEVLRQQHQPDYRDFSPSYLCLLNHQSAWKRALQTQQLTLIVEADFVPVVGFGALPLPFKATQPDMGITWLYTCAPQIYSVSAEGYAEGYSTSMVAYIVAPRGAEALLALAETTRQQVGETRYSAWDSGVDKFLRSHGLKNYIPFRNYGEHGGKPNPEHRQHGLSAAHRADVLCDRLLLRPAYATDATYPQLQLRWVRLQARCKGIARLMSGKFLRVKVLRQSSVPLKLLQFAIRRQLTSTL
ncbi:LPS biosynthesis glycosyltransferase [Oculatella sp. LEGE 06141]|uniref:LPS biosynthesis glycosyltransferase n=1 Tax=Oculatella sp. LEGE 06141 TaxID=1828648 RepID=UPI00187FF781|nr:LPS biosynthesis glycosyltransferase [Oculatella sp. LEGE 06141]MBE9182098.1 LPS biosynthesis glycosyltransferase [Oculatella sp. LEGE 06141]